MNPNGLRFKGGICVAAVLGLLLILSPAPLRSQCRALTFEGEVKTGMSFEQPIGNGWTFKLEAARSGWFVRVLPQSGARPAHDAAELATPPYHSVTPLAVTTDFSFRAQDAVAWNPRRFQFALNAATFARMQAAYAAYVSNASDAMAQSKLAELAASSPTADLRILDASLVPGTANQAQMAATVASHFSQTPHRTESGAPSPLGAVTWMRFRVTLHVPPGFAAARGLIPDPHGCR